MRIRSHFFLWQLSVLGLLATAVPVAAEPATEVDFAEAALQIDKFVAASYRRDKFAPPADSTDPVFLRRAFLVAIGRIPTPEETVTFLEIEDPAKRAKLVDYLMASRGYASHMSNWAFDLLRLTDRQPGTSARNEPYREWVRSAMDRNMAWDEFVRQLLASEGDGWDLESAAVGYYTRDRGMPLDNMANTMRIFLGSRMECAQCHDDPFGGPEQFDFYQVAAFAHGQGMVKRELMEPLWREVQDQEMPPELEMQAARVLWDRIYGMSLKGKGEGRIQLPSDYKYRDGEPGEWVGARTPFGKTIRISERRGSTEGRKEFAEWVTSQTDERFAATIANRLWARVMGRGIFEPVDDYVPPKDTAHPELMAYLAKLMVDLNYDLRAFQQVLMRTRTFGFVANAEADAGGADDLRGRRIVRLSAEQIWDSLITLVEGDPDQRPRRDMDDRIFLGGKPVLVGKKSMTELSAEVLALESEAELRAYFQRLISEIRSEGEADGGEASMASMAMSAAPTRYGANAKVRASELPSPAPRNHFLYVFGQSDRQVINGATREANVSQVLALMNGFVQSEVVSNDRAHLFRQLKGVEVPEERIRRLYLAILSRPPTAEELKWMLEEVEAAGEEGYRNIVSALVMSSEFLFLQ